MTPQLLPGRALAKRDTTAQETPERAVNISRPLLQLSLVSDHVHHLAVLLQTRLLFTQCRRAEAQAVS